jgi:hypothetical protein
MNAATMKYSNAAHDIARDMGQMAEADYMARKLVVEQARFDAERGRKAFMQRRIDQGC